MTDNEIKKALECCGVTKCKGCPFQDKFGKDAPCPNLNQLALDLINRRDAEIDILIRKKHTLRDEIAELQAEIERLQKANGLLKYLKEAVHRVEIGGKEEIVEYASDEAFQNAITKRINLMCNVQTAKSEAYKEFAERLKAYFNDGRDVMYLQTFIHYGIDRLIKELSEVSDNA